MKLKGLSALLTLGLIVFFFSCTKLNEPTQLGDGLIPAVDNVNTFDTTLTVFADYHLSADSIRNLISDQMALGRIDDPVFGSTTADMFFNLSSPVYSASPFTNKDSVIAIDSVVLSLAYTGAYGDTSAASQLNVEVSEIQPGTDFNDTTLYRYDHPGFNTGTVFGTKSFNLASLKDSITLIRRTDTSKVANVLRIRLDNTLGSRLAQFDTTSNAPYKSDSLFRAAFRGLAVKTTSASNPGALAYFNLSSAAGTGLTVYFRKKNGGVDTASATFVHSTYSQANSVRRTAAGEFLANLNKTSPQKLYIQSSPSGSYVSVNVPGLQAFPNKVIHYAELVAYRIPSASDAVFTTPRTLLLDHKGTTDTAHLFDNDVQITSTGSVDLSLFGGYLRSDNSYRFNITRYVQGIATRKEPNDTMRIYAPLRSYLFSKSVGQELAVPAISNIAKGRVVLAGDSYPDPALRLRLHIIYSNL
ncbi:DUF4270 family protein [Flavisolibacter nicotianae]|uniref:DUF4270 family protein n=1 Tax=Flavisolibacter nicotianae TaxID=2364882 RepID=UPI000EB32274|nr:DUF4270 family protein [Flavisolibacter nicotianae]